MLYFIFLFALTALVSRDGNVILCFFMALIIPIFNHLCVVLLTAAVLRYVKLNLKTK